MAGFLARPVPRGHLCRDLRRELRAERDVITGGIALRLAASPLGRIADDMLDPSPTATRGDWWDNFLQPIEAIGSPLCAKLFRVLCPDIRNAPSRFEIFGPRNRRRSNEIGVFPCNNKWICRLETEDRTWHSSVSDDPLMYRDDKPRWPSPKTYSCCGYRVTGTLWWPPRCRSCGKEMTTVIAAPTGEPS